MSDERKQADASRPQVKRALSHLARLELFTFLIERSDGKTTDEEELAETFGMSLRLVEYHLRVLEHADLIANVADEPKGESASRYVATARL
jgi:DNA-binding transcriptional ArsR family regulator